MHHGTIDKHTASGLAALKARLGAAAVPSSCLDETLTIATWNIREFGRRARREASLHYIAEVMGQFDLVSVVELRDDTRQLEQVLGYLGPYWDVVYSDYNIDRAGNHERVGFVFDRRAVVFTGLASNIHAARAADGSEYDVAGPDWWRPPYVASFRSGSFDFELLAAHIRWGGDGKAGEAARLPELKLLAEWIAKRAHKDRDLIVVGDFNIPDTESALYKAVTAKGLRMPACLAGEHGSNLERNKRYDQILHLPASAEHFTGRGGVVDFYAGSVAPLFPGEHMSKMQFTYELSDHLPLWVQVATG